MAWRYAPGGVQRTGVGGVSEGIRTADETADACERTGSRVERALDCLVDVEILPVDHSYPLAGTSSVGYSLVVIVGALIALVLVRFGLAGDLTLIGLLAVGLGAYSC